MPQLQQLQLPTWLTAPFESLTQLGGSSSSSSSASAVPAKSVGSSYLKQTAVVDSMSSSSVQAIGQMLNTTDTFPMALQPIGSSSSSSPTLGRNSSSSRVRHHHTQQHQQQQDKEDLHSGSSSSSITGQQQLLTVGTRHWGNWWDGRGLLKVKIYDFALYIDGQQVGRMVATFFVQSQSYLESYLVQL